jgi:hypothetical protein
VASAHRVITSLLLVIASAVHANGLPWEVWETPTRIAELDARDRVLERSSHCPGGCRYDRSNAGSESATSNPYPLRWLYRDGDEAVLLDERGPGALTRLWLTTGFGTSTCIDPSIRIRFHVDDAPAPALDIPLATLFDGSTPPFTPPLVADRMQSSGGYVSRVPIAYARSLRVALVGADNGGTNPCTGTSQRLLWFQLQHHQLQPGTPVTGFVAGHDEPAWRSFLAHAGDDPWSGMLAPQTATATLAPGNVIALASRSGTGWLRGIRLHLPRSAYGDVRLRVHIDGAATIDLPLTDFFATPVDAQVSPRGVLVGEDASGWLYAWFPQPFIATADVELVGDSALPAPVSVDSALSFDVGPVPGEVGRFDARSVDSCSSTSLTLDAATGAGKVVGIAARYRADGAVTRGYLEGDERAGVDGAFAPAWYGTGIEDLYDGGFYFDQGAYAAALSGASTVDTDGTGSTSVYRLMPTDPITYSSALRLVQEAGYAPDTPVPTCARAVVYAYRRAQPLLVGYDGFEIGDAAAAAAHDYVSPASTSCATLASRFEDEPPTARSALACTLASGSSRFRFRIADAGSPLRLRRTFDVGAGAPGEQAGSAAATIYVNGIAAGAFPPAAANPLRRWQQQEALLEVSAGTTDFDVVVVPDFQPHAGWFGESRWELRGGWKDAIFGDGFDVPAALVGAADSAP